MISIINYLFYASIILPNATTVCKTTNTCPITWDNSIQSHAHLEVQMKDDNDTWQSTTTTGKSFLSVIVNEDTNQFEWFVPHYLGQFWENPKRVVLEDLSTSEKYYSADFTVPGITLDMNISSQSIDSNSEVPISWSSNDDTIYGLYLLQDDIIIDTIHNVTLKTNSSFIWNVPYIPNQFLQIMIRSVDEKTYAMTDYFSILTTTTTLTTTPTTPTTTPAIDTTNTTDIGWYYILLIIIVFSVSIAVCIYKVVPILYSNKGRVSPSSIRASHQNPVYDTNRYNSKTRRPLPPISSPTNFKVVNSYNELDPSKTAVPISTEYSKLNRNEKVRHLENQVYEEVSVNI